MITAYKFLTPQLTSYNDFKWEIGETYTIDRPGNEMCSRDVFHCYNHPLLAEFIMPLHLSGNEYVLYKIEVPEFVNNDGLKFASKSQKVIKKVERPVITKENRIEIAIRVAKLVCVNAEWNEWADKWLTGEDRTESSAASAASAAAHYAAASYYAVDYASIYFTDKYKFNKKLIEIIEMVCKK